MSLIIDALKKAQQLRLKEPKGTPFSTHSHPDNKKSLRSLGKRWTVIGIGLASLVIFALVFWRLFSPPSTSIPIRTAARIEKKAPVPIEEKKPQEPSKDIMSLPKDVQSLPKDALSSTPTLPSPLKGAGLVGNGPPIKEKKEEPLTKPMVMEKKAIQVIPPIKSATEKSLSPLSPASLKEKAPAKSIEVKREGEKEPPFASEILTHFNLGVQLYSQREFLKAIQAYRKVIELDPTYIEAYNNLGIIYQEIGDLDRAFEAFQKAIEINPQYEKGHNNLGILLYLKGRNEEALEAFQKALAINANNIESHINLGVLFKKQGQLNKAIESYQKALEINPLHREIHYNIALLYEQLENIELAISHYQQFIKLSSTSHSDLVSRVQRHLDDLIKTKNKKQ
jgi:Tfp pilus assembly protein PilF